MKSHKPIANLASTAEAQACAAKPPENIRRYQSRDLFGEPGEKPAEIEIEHNGAIYRLRQTSLGKLILTK